MKKIEGFFKTFISSIKTGHLQMNVIEQNKIDEDDREYKKRQRDYSRQYRIDNKEKCNLQKKEYYDNNLEKCKETSIERGATYRANNKEKIKERDRKYRESKKLKKIEDETTELLGGGG